jgi:SAM-dependent methyltransferase
MATRREHEAKDRFSERYREERVDVVRTIEHTVIGGDWGANGYTTIAQADELAALLDLQQHSLLLDVGAGRGWPGLYLATTTGCSVVLTDVPMEGLSVARERSRQDALGGRAWCVNANARDVPFRAATFDAVVHTDVLC